MNLNYNRTFKSTASLFSRSSQISHKMLTPDHKRPHDCTGKIVFHCQFYLKIMEYQYHLFLF